ncbi:hypothetical protein [Cupriavidus pauculus]|uniref:hypothetical protein n=1 Tax=Cupriavidus pauculus TaxID=82633 RepID=UPI0038577D10
MQTPDLAPAAPDLNQAGHLYAAVLNHQLALPNATDPAASQYGCRWCEPARAWFTVLPAREARLADSVVALCNEIGAAVTVHTTPNGGDIQVSAFL